MLTLKYVLSLFMQQPFFLFFLLLFQIEVLSKCTGIILDVDLFVVSG